MNRVSIGRHYGAQSANLDAYRPLVGDGLVEEIWELAGTLRGLRICHVNSTAAGGGVAELLGREVPLLQALGLRVDWQIIRGEEEFFTVTKGFHNALQAGRFDLTPAIEAIYLRQNEKSAEIFADEYDVYIVHDPQPAALCRYRRRPGERWIWRSHIDSSAPNPKVWEFLRPVVQEYDAAVFTMKEFIPPDLTGPRLEIIPPAIDPLSTKNMALPSELCRRAIADLGVDLRRPIALQVSRFDPWKDPLGVIHAFRLARREVPDLQLVLLGALAGDDPEGWAILDQVNDVAGADPNILVFTNMTGVGNMEVNVFQRGADLVVQKSLKEGFGLVVSEALWKGKAVVGGNAGGIPMQIPPPYHSFLVETAEECARKMVELLYYAEVRQAFGEAGRRHVRQHFLLPRLIRDELRLIRSLAERIRQ
ncbi:MAG: glycosyltransferase [Candidatus Methylomirabilia bacterium]